MSAQIIPFQYQQNSIRAFADESGAPWFVASDVCETLQFGNGRQAISRLDDDEKDVRIVDTLGGGQEMTVINESGLFHLILTSRKQEAKQFRKWVTAEVLPSIRKTGTYTTTITPAQQLQIRRAVAKVAKGTPDNFSKVYHRLYDAFGIGKYEQLPATRFEDAIQFLEAIEGEYLPAREQPAPIQNALLELPNTEDILKQAVVDHLTRLRVLVSIGDGLSTTMQIVDPGSMVFCAKELPGLIANGGAHMPKNLMSKIIEAAVNRLQE